MRTRKGGGGAGGGPRKLRQANHAKMEHSYGERHSFLSLYGNPFYRISIPQYCEIERQEARSVTFSRARGTEDSGNTGS